MSEAIKDETQLRAMIVLRNAADNIEKSEIPEADRLSQSQQQSEKTRTYFASRVDILNTIATELRTMARQIGKREATP